MPSQPAAMDVARRSSGAASTTDLRRVARDAARSLPPAAVRPERRTVLINIKVSVDLADALADRASEQRLTQKQVICRALADAGLPVDPLDLADRSPQRRRKAA